MQNNNNNCVGTNNDTKLAMVDTSFWIYNVHPILSSGGGAYPRMGHLAGPARLSHAQEILAPMSLFESPTTTAKTK